MRKWPLALLSILLIGSIGLHSTSQDKLEFTRKLVTAAVERASVTVRYDGAYVAIPYPNGDVPADTGVCTDEIIRIYRAVGIDLQKEVHEDFTNHRSQYPRWNTRRADTNIDHRRVPNLMVFFKRHGESLPVTKNAADYLPGDIVTWELSRGGMTHIGMVVDRKPQLFDRYMILHNIGDGPQIEDVLFAYRITGHFRYYGPVKTE